MLDLIVVKFFEQYMSKPIHFFGGIGIVIFALGFFAGLIAIILKIIGLRDFVTTPLPLLSALCLIVGIQLILIGILGEILIRIYYEAQDKKSYEIKERIGF